MKTIVRSLIISFILTMVWQGLQGIVGAKASYIDSISTSIERVQ